MKRDWLRCVGWWLLQLSCFAVSSIIGGFVYRIFELYLFHAFPPSGRSWPVGWAALLICFFVVTFGVFLIKWRHYVLGFAVSGFGAGCAAMGSFGILLLKILPSC